MSTCPFHMNNSSEPEDVHFTIKYDQKVSNHHLFKLETACSLAITLNKYSFCYAQVIGEVESSECLAMIKFKMVANSFAFS